MWKDHNDICTYILRIQWHYEMCVKVGMKPGHSTVPLPAQRELIQPSEIDVGKNQKPKKKDLCPTFTMHFNWNVPMLLNFSLAHDWIPWFPSECALSAALSRWFKEDMLNSQTILNFWV